MNTRTSRLFRTGILALNLLSSLALADPAEDTALGEAAFNREDLTVAMEYFTKAANQNYAPAQVRLGEILDASEFNKEAADWYRKAAEQGNAAGEYHLGHMYAVGEGVERSDEKALYWLERAAEKNDLLALKTLAHAYQKGELGLNVDLEQAKSLENRANVLDAKARRAAKKAAAVKAAEKAKQGAVK